MDALAKESIELRRIDYGLLGVALGLGITAALRSFGVGRVTLPAALFLGGCVLLALPPLIRLFGGGGASPYHRRTILAVILGTHLVATLFFFPPEDIINPRPVLTLDHSVHFYQAQRAREMFWSSLRFHGYDPYFMAGYPGGTIFDIDTKGVELWCALLRFIDTARAYKLFILLGYMLMVFTLYGGYRRLRYRFDESIYALLVVLAFWHWGRPQAGEFRYAGMFAFLLVSHLSFYIAGLYRSFLSQEPVKRFYILGPLAFFIHPTAAVILPPAFLALFFTDRRAVPPGREHLRWERRVLSKLALWCLLIVGANALWLIPFFRYLDIKVPSETFFQFKGLGGMLKVLIKPGNLPALFLIVLAGTGFMLLLQEKRFSSLAAPVATSAFLLFLAAFGIYIPLFDQMEPGRFLLPALIFMAPLSGAGCRALMEAAGRIIPPPRLRYRVKTAALVVLLLCAPVFALIASREYFRYTLSTTFTPEVERLIEELKRNTDRSGRLMIEDGQARTFGECLLPSILPLYTGVEQIGGPYPYAFIKHNFTTFQGSRAMGVPLSRMEPDRMLEYLRLYRVRWILSCTPVCREYLRRIPGVRVIWTAPDFCLGEVPADSLYAAEGFTVRATYDRIEVSISPENGQLPPENIVLGYHWDRGLRVDPPARISPVMRLEDPVPLILLEPRGERRIKIYYR
ncbi:MAG: hypothetical protein JXB45_02405 [Candidatus Krumholzibacteriota bacterium]|nr:hypothetical protein [Candidatus Krumholzibacteriota bacterium]